ncbi:MAG TPA: caspase family protein, partial [Saprospiraceae bacterium]|nr:caspase family protein [Saprospiraceae bacterium]
MKTWMILLGWLCLQQTASSQGCTKGDCLNGFGTYQYSSGSYYTGEFKGGKRHGKGIFYYSNQNKYLGDWKMDRRHGEGKMQFQNGDVYKGAFFDDRMEGQGTMDFASQDRYSGSWKNNKPNGTGSYYFHSGERYEGQFADARFEGEGCLYYKNGSSYKGQWKASKKDGLGIFKDKDGRTVAAHWSQDKLVRVVSGDPATTASAHTRPSEQPKIETTPAASVPNQKPKPVPEAHTASGNEPATKLDQQVMNEGWTLPGEEKQNPSATTARVMAAPDDDFTEPEPETAQAQPAATNANESSGDQTPYQRPTNQTNSTEGTPAASAEQKPISDTQSSAQTEPASELSPSTESKPNTETAVVESTQPQAQTDTFKPLVDDESKLPDCNTEYCESGLGVLTYGDGSRYVGEFVDGEPFGRGSCYYSNGDRYQGRWENHAPQGEGTMYFVSGLSYTAQWDRGQATKVVDRKKHFVFDSTIAVDRNPEVKIWAVLIGISRYAHMPSLKYSDDDTYKIYAFLKSPEGGALRDEQIRILIDEDATKLNILQAINQVFMKADENDVVMLYYSGHGLEGTFLPIDYDGKSNLLQHEDVKALFDRSLAKHKVCYVDACHSGSLLATKGPYSKSLFEFYEALDHSRGGTAFVLSSKSKEFSLEDGGLRQGVFSHFLIKGLKGGADRDHDHTITIKEL